jgi:hypothetical protein
MEIDHIFVFSNNNGKEADDLIQFGLTEGSNRIHPGQGTVNRKFYFENIYLELLWVINEEEILNERTAKTKLWERSQFQQNGNSPFGLCLVNLDDTDTFFLESDIYQPTYLPKGKYIDIITNDQNPKSPWTFRLPQRIGKRKQKNQPIIRMELKNLQK